MENLKKLNSLFKDIKSKVKEKISKLEINNINLRQSNFFIRSLTWGLISTSGLTISWLAFAYTEEIVIVKGKLEPIGGGKIPTSTICFTKVGIPINIRVDSFPANDFALLKVVIESIGSDVLDLNLRKLSRIYFPGSIKLNS